MILYALIFLASLVVGEDEASYSYSFTSQYGPEYWYLLEFDDENQCGSGSLQSPIYLKRQGCSSYADSIVEYNNPNVCTTADFAYAYTDHNIEAYYQGQDNGQTCTMTFENYQWSLASLHLHLGWEHLPKEIKSDETYHTKKMELHLFHAGANDGNANTNMVVAVRLEAKGRSDNPVVQQLLSQWSWVESACADVEQAVNRCVDQSDPLSVYKVIPDTASFFRYSGSLTTPPCTENVEWVVVEETIPVSNTQFERLRDLVVQYYDANCEKATVADTFNRTVRFPQPTNDRSVSLLCPTSRKQRQRTRRGVGGGVGVLAVAGAYVLATRKRKTTGKMDSDSTTTSTESLLKEEDKELEPKSVEIETESEDKADTQP